MLQDDLFNKLISMMMLKEFQQEKQTSWKSVNPAAHLCGVTYVSKPSLMWESCG